MKQPKEPKSWKYPRLYTRIDNYDHSYSYDRIRIVYPNGHAEWGSHFGSWPNLPCWHSRWRRPSLKALSPDGQVKRMKAYDKRLRRKTIFIGEIK